MLEDDEKFVFLDISCCLRGWNLTKVEEILHAHYGDIMKDHINVLVEKSLIKISDSGNVTLHDLIEDMGKEIVRQESLEDPGKRTKLWDSKDIKKVFKENTVSYNDMDGLTFHLLTLINVSNAHVAIYIINCHNITDFYLYKFNYTNCQCKCFLNIHLIICYYIG